MEFWNFACRELPSMAHYCTSFSFLRRSLQVWWLLQDWLIHEIGDFAPYFAHLPMIRIRLDKSALLDLCSLYNFIQNPEGTATNGLARRVAKWPFWRFSGSPNRVPEVMETDPFVTSGKLWKGNTLVASSSRTNTHSWWRGRREGAIFTAHPIHHMVLRCKVEGVSFS